MTLRIRTLLITGLTLLGLLGVLFIVAQLSLSRGFSLVEKNLDSRFAQFERSDTHKNMRRALDALNSRIDNIATKAADWAQWDDTYRYVEDLNARYARSNLSEQALSALKLNYMAIVNKSGTIVFSFAYDLGEEKKITLASGVEDDIVRRYSLLSHADPRGLISGIVLSRQGVMMLASRPIVTSSAHGPIRGAVIFGQFLNDSALANLSRLTHLDIDVKLFDDPVLNDDFNRARLALNGREPFYLQTPTSDSIFGYAALPDIVGKPAMLLRVGLPREINWQGRQTLREVRAQGEKTLLTVLVGVSVTGVVLGTIILLILELLVLSRLKRLSFCAGRIAESKDFSKRVAVEGTDELATVGLSMNRMLDSLAQTHHELRRRTTEMHLLMTSVPVGLLSLNEQLRVNAEYSRSAESIVGGSDLTGRPFIEILGLSPPSPRIELGAKYAEFLELFQKEALPEKEMAGLSPIETLELTVASKSKWIHLSHYLIRRGEQNSNHVLVVMEDISEAKALEEQVVRSQQENLQLKAIVEEPDLFREFMAEARTLLQSAQQLALALTPLNTSLSAIAEIFRNVHTIKGIAGAFALRHITLQAGKTEERLSSMRKNNHVSAETIAALRDDISLLEQAIDEVKKLTSSIIGEDADETCGATLRISLADLKGHIAEIQAMRINGDLKESLVAAAKEEVIKRLSSLKLIAASKGLGKAVKIIPDLIGRLGKEAKFTFEGKDVPIDCEMAHELSAPLVHLLRNAVDHGLESPEQRLSAGKAVLGEIKLSIHSDHNELVIEIIDDGKGMDPEHLKKIALAKNFLSPREAQALTPQQCFELILKPGFTTKSEVTEVSGRGVGLDVVVHSVKNKLKGDIRIESQPGKGSRFILRVPLYIKDPAS